MFGVTFLVIDVLDPPQAEWSISTGVSKGNAGHLIASGTAPATVSPLNCGAGLPFICGAVSVSGLSVKLQPGKYWLSVVPQCTNTNDHECDSARYFLADVEDHPPHEHFGPRDVWDDSFFTSSHGSYFEPTAGVGGVCGTFGCDLFSAGVEGTVNSHPE